MNKWDYVTAPKKRPPKTLRGPLLPIEERRARNARIRAMRADGMSIPDIAATIGLDPDYCGEISRGRRDPERRCKHDREA